MLALLRDTLPSIVEKALVLSQRDELDFVDFHGKPYPL